MQLLLHCMEDMRSAFHSVQIERCVAVRGYRVHPSSEKEYSRQNPPVSVRSASGVAKAPAQCEPVPGLQTLHALIYATHLTERIEYCPNVSDNHIAGYRSLGAAFV